MSDPPERGGWLAPGFAHPLRAELAPGVHLRPIRADDVDIDYPAVMGSRERLWATYGGAWGWPSETMTVEADRDDLAHHEREIEAHESFNYAILDEHETRLLGCVYLDPPGPGDDGDVAASWWLVDELADTQLQAELDAFVPRWLSETWGFRRPIYAP